MADNQRTRSSVHARDMNEFLALRNQEIEDRLGGIDRSPVARAVAGTVAGAAGVAVGVPRGALHSVQGAIDGAGYAYQLANPLDPGHDTAVARLVDTGNAALNYARTATPQTVGRDILNGVHRFRIETDPTATPMGGTASEEAARRFRIGANQGEAAFNLATLLGGGTTLAKGLSEANTIFKAADPAKYIAQGYSPGMAQYLTKPYVGMGSHYYPRNPGKLGKLPLPRLPKAISDSSFNVLEPRGISQGDFYELHSAVDPSFRAARPPRKFAREPWKAANAGIEAYPLPARLWHGAPPPLKITAGGATAFAGVGSLSYNPFTEEPR